MIFQSGFGDCVVSDLRCKIIFSIFILGSYRVYIENSTSVAPCTNMDYHKLYMYKKYIPSNAWDEIAYPFSDFNYATAEVWWWISNFILHLMMIVST